MPVELSASTIWSAWPASASPSSPVPAPYSTGGTPGSWHRSSGRGHLGGPFDLVRFVPLGGARVERIDRGRARRTHNPGRFPMVVAIGLVDLGEEVVALVVDDDEGREVLDLDPPDRLHAELGVLQHLDLGDAVLGQPGRRAADRAQVEAAVVGAGVGHLLDRLPLASITSEPPAAWNWST